MVDYLKKSIIQIAGKQFLANLLKSPNFGDPFLVLQLGKLPLEREEQNVEGLEILDDFLQNENELALCGFLEERDNLRFSKTVSNK